MLLEKATDKELSQAVGKFCKKFRVDYLEISMTNFAKETGLNIQNVNAFESGRANNLKYIFHYYNQADEQLKELFKNNLFNIIC